MSEPKLTETYSVRISEDLKHMTDKLNSDQKHRLAQRIRIEIARSVHESQFDPKLYLGDSE